uniref:Shavenoid isoform B-like N-terminal domain-containing protein n=1 Tax=Strongyloides venezuelensis TaxID=75913 RepID=A0A0K0F2J9_STRVS
MWNSLHRSIGSPDIIYLPKNNNNCTKILNTLSKGAETNNNSNPCQCPFNAPIFNPQTNKCIERLDNECSNGITFDISNYGDSIYLPVLNLPKKGNELIDSRRIRWKDSGIFKLNNNNISCKIMTAEILDSTTNWRMIDINIFKFMNDHDNIKIIWNGLPKDARMVEGSIVKLKLNCLNSTLNEYCMPFRVQGYQFFGITDIDINNFNALRFTIVVIIILAIALILVTFTSIILWLICWKIKKTEIYSTFQLQFLQHIKQEKERSAADVAKYRAALAAAQHGDISGRGHCFNGIDDKNDNSLPLINNPNSIIQQKKKLYFSTEFFEPHMMANPPEIAEQFLVELRKMVDNAKKRIKLQKHVPSLFSIPEEPLDLEEELQEIFTDIKEEVVCNSSTNSPKSTKSSDSGRESMKDSGSNNESPNSSPVLKKKESATNNIEKTVKLSPNTYNEVIRLKKVVKPSLPKSKNVASLIGAFEQKKEIVSGKKEMNEKEVMMKKKLVNEIDKEIPPLTPKGISKIPKPSEKNIAVSPKLSQRKLIPMESLPIDKHDTKKSIEQINNNRTLNNGNDKNNPTISKIPGIFSTNSPTKNRHNAYSIISTGSEAMRKKSLPRKSKKPSVVCRETSFKDTANIPTIATKINSNGVIETNM